MANHQRIGAISNTHAGREFEREANEYFLRVESLALTSDFNVDIGVGTSKKTHGFDLGSKNPPVLIECKSYNWTETGNMSSAKITVWNEAMYIFHLAPRISEKYSLFFGQSILRARKHLPSTIFGGKAISYQKVSPSLSTIQNQAMHAISRVRANRRIYLNKYFLHTFSLLSTTPAAAAAGISALHSLAIVKSRGPLPASLGAGQAQRRRLSQSPWASLFPSVAREDRRRR